ncbi:cytokinin-responsive gata factor 1 [Prunus dulcis]|uniref:Cytokinin-responsive gata factor 1 n=1 Tax=Prunus dulcis TaxID=3755 RepID=A0A4Y1RX08_PRUDU|nr:cytokinin-responsive gata factor 1 [Prunus dulcis]
MGGDGGDHDHQYHHLFNLEPQTSFSSSSLSGPIFLNPSQAQAPSGHYREPQNFQFQLLEADHHNIVSYGDHVITTLKPSKTKVAVNGAGRNGNPSTDKWMSSKMRMMKKMTNPDQTSSSCTSSDDKPVAMKLSISHKSEEQKPQHPDMISCSNKSSNNMNNNVPIIRSLCNACGIRQRKARRAMAAAAAAASGTTLAAAPSMKSTSKAQHKDNKPRVASTVPFKKRPYNKLSSTPPSKGRPPKKLCFEDFAISMNNNHSSSATTTTTTSLQRVFPQDEKEAAILLMALSCGLVHG